MRKFAKYFGLLKGARIQFAAAVLAGLVYAAASGAGMPLMVKTVFPLIFNNGGTIDEVQEEMAAEVGPEQAEEWLREAAPDKFTNLEKTSGVRDYVIAKFGEEKAPMLLLIGSCALLPIVSALRGASGFLNTYWMVGAGRHVLVQIQYLVFSKLQRLPLSFFSRQRTGDLISRVTSDSASLQAMLTTVVNDLIKQPAIVVAALVYLASDALKNSDGAFLVISMISIPLVVLPVRFVGRRLTKRARRMQKRSGGNSAILAETLGATREIRAFNLEDLMAERYRDGLNEWVKLQLKVVRYRSATSPMIEVVSAVAVAAALYYAASGGMTLERFLAVVAALYMGYEGAKKLGTVYNRFNQGQASLERLEEVLDADEQVKDPPQPRELPEVRGALRFENVSFAYGGDRAALKDVSAEIPAGQIVALVGPSGAGKTTFASMVPRFYDPTAGSITLDGADLRDLRVKELRDQITLVPQEAILLSGTVAENIRLGRIEASDEDVRSAAVQANADAFISEADLGYETPVGERGLSLSGGQKQRISIARAFLKDAPVLILDEATSALDAESESQIQVELANLARGRTTLIIAHRFSSIRIADRILVFDHGRIVGDGTFEELAESNALFRSLLEKQQR